MNEADREYGIGRGLAAVRALPEVEPRFLRYAIRGHLDSLHAASTGTTFAAITSEDLQGLRLPAPSPDEQRRIADFLDDQVGLLDQAIALRQQQIDLLAEVTASKIDALVRGDDGSVTSLAEFRPFGAVPNHWQQGRLRSVRCEVQTGPFGSQLHADEYVEGGWPIVNPANLKREGIIADDKMTVSDETCSRLSRHVLREGDVVFGRRGELGRAALVTADQAGWLCGTGSLRVRFVEESFDPSYLSRFLRLPATRFYFKSTSVGSTMDNLNTGILLAMPLLIPPLSEQVEIARFCDSVAIQSIEATALLLRSKDLLQERKQSLIAAAVTGEFDVSAARSVA